MCLGTQGDRDTRTPERPAGVVQRRTPDGALVVHGVEPAFIGELAASNGITLHELSPQLGSLEEAFMQLTKESVEYHAAD